MVILMVFHKGFLDSIKQIKFLIGIKANSVQSVTEWNSSRELRPNQCRVSL